MKFQSDHQKRHISDGTPRNKKIIPGVTPCCSAVACDIQDNGNHLIFDADCTVEGDMIMCPVHHDVVLFLEGTGFWKLLGDKKWEVYCSKCCRYYTMSAWSYAG